MSAGGHDDDDEKRDGDGEERRRGETETEDSEEDSLAGSWDNIEKWEDVQGGEVAKRVQSWMLLYSPAPVTSPSNGSLSNTPRSISHGSLAAVGQQGGQNGGPGRPERAEARVSSSPRCLPYEWSEEQGRGALYAERRRQFDGGSGGTHAS